MALDTVQQRASVLGIAWPDGDLSVADRATIIGVYWPGGSPTTTTTVAPTTTTTAAPTITIVECTITTARTMGCIVAITA